MSGETQRAVVELIRQGAAPIPVPAGQKNPGLRGWESLRITEEEVSDYWTNGQNVGLLCGEPSGWRVDVDLDSDEAVKVAFRFLPATLTSGRTSRPHSHCWYVAPGAESADWNDGDGKKLLEMRSTGRQTLVAPSTHPDGDGYVWHSEADLEVAEVSAVELRERCRELATAALVARHVPPEGSRHDYAMALAGFVLRGGRMEACLALKVLKAAWHAANADSREALRDLEGIVSDTEENLAAGEPVVGGPTLEEMAPGIVHWLCKWWGWNSRNSGDETAGAGADPEQRKPTQAELLVRRAAGVELFHTPAGDAYATVPVGDHRETHPIKSKGFRRWLVRGYFEEHERPPGSQALQDTLGLLEAQAQFEGSELEVYVRVAEHDGAVYVDLANERWEAVEIDAGGWRVLSDAPVRFRRPRGLLPLPTPTRGGRVDELRRFVNVSDETSWRLMVAWLVQAFRPGYPYPVIILEGEQGSAKSSAARLLLALVDPSAAPLRTTPRNEHDLYIAAENGHVVAFDNISNLKSWLSDALCRLSTGGGFGTRTLYENREQELFEGMRPVILNGITDVASRPDLLDRALIVTLPHIPEEHRKVEAKLWRDFERARPAILGALFDAVSGAIVTVPSLRLEGLPRMADFAAWATAAEGALGWEKGTFMAAYVGNREEATETALEADPVAGAVREFMKVRDEWRGTAGELWKTMYELVDEDIRRTDAWPKAPNALSARMKRLAPALRGIGIEYAEDRDKSARKKTLTKKRRAKDRHYRHHRHPEEKHPQKGGFAGDGPDDGLSGGDDSDRHGDDPAHETVTRESRIGKGNAGDDDGRDGDDDDMRLFSSEKTWPSRSDKLGPGQSAPGYELSARGMGVFPAEAVAEETRRSKSGPALALGTYLENPTQERLEWLTKAVLRARGMDTVGWKVHAEAVREAVSDPSSHPPNC